MIYCVVPPELEEELYAQLLEYYKANPNVSVIIDRREGPNRRDREVEPPPEIAEQRKTRDRRRPRIAGTFPTTDLPDSE
jgi:hypothetical protein